MKSLWVSVIFTNCISHFTAANIEKREQIFLRTNISLEQYISQPISQNISQPIIPKNRLKYSILTRRSKSVEFNENNIFKVTRDETRRGKSELTINKRTDFISINPIETLGAFPRPAPPKVLVKESEILGFLGRMAKFANYPYCSNNNEIGQIAIQSGIIADIVFDPGTTEMIAYFRGMKPSNRPKRRKMVSYKRIQNLLVDMIWYDEVEAMIERMISKIEDLFKSQKLRILQMRFTGHGIGGVYAVLAAISFAEYMKDLKFTQIFGKIYVDIAVVTFGQPRIGNAEFANYVNNLLKNQVYRVTYKNDPVPLFPINSGDSDEFKHHEIEYWIALQDCDCTNIPKSQKDVELFECRGVWEHELGISVGENPDCIAGTVSGDISVHYGPYFNVLMSECGPQNLNNIRKNYRGFNQKNVILMWKRENRNFQSFANVQPLSSNLGTGIGELYPLYPHKKNISHPIYKSVFKKFAKFANLAYCHNSNDYGKVFLNFVADIFLDKTSYQVVAYFGTNRALSPKQWSLRENYLIKYPFVSGASVDKTWYDQVEFIMPRLLEDSIPLFSPGPHGLKRMSFTGHGIAYAVLAALSFRKHILLTRLYKYVRIVVVTFGQPRIGNPVLAAHINKVLNVYRITHTNDHVPRFPPREKFYEHHETEFWISHPDCDCRNPYAIFSENQGYFELYRCPGYYKDKSIFGENLECNQGQGLLGQNLLDLHTPSPHFGPYFDIFMKNCK
ncbi:hypothetical protein G9A89_006753 [Geosiphon pyriformis]|nr:hypothetical protein G9A89_006753 [Geosiphon pyriformis]